MWKKKEFLMRLTLQAELLFKKWVHHVILIPDNTSHLLRILHGTRIDNCLLPECRWQERYICFLCRRQNRLLRAGRCYSSSRIGRSSRARRKSRNYESPSRSVDYEGWHEECVCHFFRKYLLSFSYLTERTLSSRQTKRRRKWRTDLLTRRE